MAVNVYPSGPLSLARLDTPAALVTSPHTSDFDRALCSSVGPAGPLLIFFCMRERMKGVRSIQLYSDWYLSML